MTETSGQDPSSGKAERATEIEKTSMQAQSEHQPALPHTTTHDAEYQTTKQANEMQPPKRGRGRPRKSDSEKAKPDEGPKRGPGRPPKKLKRGLGRPPAATKVVTASAQPYSEPKRGPGRPRKAKPATVTQSPSSLTPKRRGRPRKAGDAGQAPQGYATATKKPSQVTRGRGRPPKKPSITGTDINTVPIMEGKAFMERVVGTYQIECAAVAENWPDQAGDMYMAITISDENPIGAAASFSLGVLEGTMLLSGDSRRLKELRLELVKTSHSESEHEDAEESSGSEERARSAKRVKVAMPEVIDNRLFFVWQGRDTTDDKIETDTGINVGHIQFAANDGAAFSGAGNFAYLGQMAPFRGHKIDRSIRAYPKPWNTFSAAADAQE